MDREPFDLFLVDHWMPGSSGADFTRALRELNQTTPVVFYSGAALEADKREAFEAGAQAYLVKPTGIDELIEVMNRFLVSAR
jgi:DNA-binding response OmpR family regulator